MLVIPAIDLKDGRCVRLRQGDLTQETVYADDAVAMARHWETEGARLLHLVDLNGAVEGRPANFDIIERIAKAVTIPLQVGGGIRTMQSVERYLSIGITRVVLGTAVLHDERLFQQACDRYPGQIVAGVDARDGKLAVRGWTAVSEVDVMSVLGRLNHDGLSGVIYTDIARDGMLSGPNLDALGAVAEASPVPVIASGGIATIEHLCAVRALGPRIHAAIVGKALYDRRIDLRAAIQAVTAAVC